MFIFDLCLFLVLFAAHSHFVGHGSLLQLRKHNVWIVQNLGERLLRE
jgi:hypothetical protein